MTAIQKALFQSHFGNFWWKINQETLAALAKENNDGILMLMDTLPPPKCVLEIGCANGWRLELIREKYKCETYGIDPSFHASQAGGGGMKNLYVATADSLPFPGRFFDAVIYGYCLAYVDPSLYFTVMAEGDRVLADGGHLYIYDSVSPRPIKRRYSHVRYKDGRNLDLWAYQMDFAKLWLAHPFYRQVIDCIDPDKLEGVTVLQKDSKIAFMQGGTAVEAVEYEIK